MANGRPGYGGTNLAPELDLGTPGTSRYNAGTARFTCRAFGGADGARKVEQTFEQQNLVTRDERPVKVSRREDGGDVDESDDADLPSGIDEEDDDGRERIGEDESEAAPAAID